MEGVRNNPFFFYLEMGTGFINICMIMNQSTIKLICEHCGTSFFKKRGEHNCELRKKPNKKFFCSKKCSTLHRTILKRVSVQCNFCKKDCVTDENDLKRNKNYYCSWTCYEKKRNIGKELVELTCPNCNSIFYNSRNKLNGKLRKGAKNIFCSSKCSSEFQRNDYSKWFDLDCDECGQSIKRQGRQLSLSKLHFCSPTCKGTYFSRINAIGEKRSLLEVKLESHIKNEFPDLVFNTNDRDILGGLELDFYFPNLRLGIEINGPAHYTPIWGDKSFSKTKRNDILKKAYCKKNYIRLLEITDILNYTQDNSYEIFIHHIKPLLTELISEVNILEEIDN